MSKLLRQMSQRFQKTQVLAGQQGDCKVHSEPLLVSLSNQERLKPASFDNLRMSGCRWMAALCNRPGPCSAICRVERLDRPHRQLEKDCRDRIAQSIPAPYNDLRGTKMRNRGTQRSTTKSNVVLRKVPLSPPSSQAASCRRRQGRRSALFPKLTAATGPLCVPCDAVAGSIC